MARDDRFAQSRIILHVQRHRVIGTRSPTWKETRASLYTDRTKIRT
uniref:Uncharacterized protein n=1 Tax=Setaria italica TaxID=4555 RepID=K4AND9_SETIT